MPTRFCPTRRQILLGWACLLATASLPTDALASKPAPFPNLSGLSERRLRLHDPGCGESLQIRYWRDGRYDRDMLAVIDWFMRDRRAETARPMDRLLLDLLCSIHMATGSSEPLTILSGYRSPETNATLVDAGTGAVRNSYHTLGRAVDLRLAGFSTKGLRELARSNQIGGVGYYPRDGFVHLDTGPPRSWRGRT